jgi:outer membrane protein assembly factor BamD (BamD/ComL family)
LDQLTRRAVEEMDAQHWAEARQLLVRVEEQEPGYGETERLLVMVESKIEEAAAEGQKQGQISALYEEAQKLARARQWRQVLSTMGQLHVLDPQFPDPEGLVARAQQGNESEDKDAQWQSAALYIEALHSLRLGQYQDALTKIGQVQALDPQFSDPEEIAAQAQSGLAENRDRGRQAQLAALYQDSHRLVRAHQWQQALAKMNEILILDPKFKDPDGLLATARHGASAEERRSKKLEELYQHAVWMMNNGRWAEAQRLFLQVQELQPGYRQTERYLTRLAKGL